MTRKIESVRTIDEIKAIANPEPVQPGVLAMVLFLVASVPVRNLTTLSLGEILPYLGGAAAVWTTCVLFFQFMLLMGYVYAHLLSRIADTRKQMLAHVFVLLLPLAFLPIRFGEISTEALSLHPSAQF